MSCPTCDDSDVGEVLVVTSTTRPTGGDLYVGRVIYESDTGFMYVYTGIGWIKITLDSIADAAGDMIYATAADTLARLAIGTFGQTLRVNSGATAPQWSNGFIVTTSAARPTSSPEGITIYETDTNRVLYHDGTNWIVLAEPDQTWSPSFNSGVTVGNGVWSDAVTHRSDGWMDFGGTFTLGTTSAITGDIVLTLPTTLVNARDAGRVDVKFRRSGSTYVPGWVAYNSTTLIRLRATDVSSTYGSAVACSAAIPFAWGTGDEIMVGGRVRMATKYS